jgi:hypothetical protein
MSIFKIQIKAGKPAVFDPNPQTVYVNDSVFWFNGDKEAHWPAPSASNPTGFIPFQVSPNTSSNQVGFASAQTISYVCVNHPGESGQIIVKTPKKSALAKNTKQGALASKTKAGALATNTKAGALATSTKAGALATNVKQGALASKTKAGALASNVKAGALATKTKAGALASSPKKAAYGGTTKKGAFGGTTDKKR